MPKTYQKSPEEMGAYNEYNTFGVDMDNPVAPWFANGDDENGGPDASGSFYCFFFLFSLLDDARHKNPILRNPRGEFLCNYNPGGSGERERRGKTQRALFNKH